MKYLALIAHDRCKSALVEFARDHLKQLLACNLVCTKTTGYELQKALGLNVTTVNSGPLGGDLEIGAMVATGKIEGIIFLRDVLTARNPTSPISPRCYASATCTTYRLPPILLRQSSSLLRSKAQNAGLELSSLRPHILFMRNLFQCATAFAALAFLTAPLAAQPNAGAAKAEPRLVSPRGPLLADEQRIVNAFEAAAPSVAYITTETVNGNPFFQQEVSQGAGTGFVWDTNGHVVTNSHVVNGARKVFVQLDAGKPIEASLVGIAPEYDLAVLRLNRMPTHLKAIPLGESKNLKIGQTVYAIGNPFGLSRTLTTGIVSALDRELPTTNFREVIGVIQTDAAINPGNSGGPLLDSAGRLIGVNTAIRSASGSSSGIGFAIPADLVNRIVPALISRGRAPLPGIGFSPLAPNIAARAGLRGVVVDQVGPNSPAAKAGLIGINRQQNSVGDIIIAVNGKPVESLSNFIVELERAGIDSTVELTVERDGKERKVKVRVIDVRA